MKLLFFNINFVVGATYCIYFFSGLDSQSQTSGGNCGSDGVEPLHWRLSLLIRLEGIGGSNGVETLHWRLSLLIRLEGIGGSDGTGVVTVVMASSSETHDLEKHDPATEWNEAVYQCMQRQIMTTIQVHSVEPEGVAALRAFLPMDTTRDPEGELRSDTEEWNEVIYQSMKVKLAKTIRAISIRPEGAAALRDFLPTHTARNAERESRLMQKMQVVMEKLEGSKFYRAFRDQMQSLEMTGLFTKVLGAEDKMAMVVYGIGSIESCEEGPISQLALAMLMKKHVPWIGDVEIYDPVISGVESKVMSDLGCSVLSVNENCRRKVLKPTLFFMPHCHYKLYEYLLQTNWDVDRRCKIALLGNSFVKYRDMLRNKKAKTEGPLSCLLDALRFTKEIPLDLSDTDHDKAFGCTSWQFFGHERGGDK